MTRPRCHCGVYTDCHARITDHQPRRASRLRLWFRDHSLTSHLLVPIWVRVPEKQRWTVVHWLNKSPRRCWSDLVGDALTHREDDACDTHRPALRAEKAPRCATTCDWMGGAVMHDHEGEHDCQCYCGKFQFRAAEGADDRRAHHA